MYKEKFDYNCFQKLSTLKLKTSEVMKLWNSCGRKSKAKTRALYPALSQKVRLSSYLFENSQKSTLYVYFKLIFSVKPKRCQIYVSNDGLWN